MERAKNRGKKVKTTGGKNGELADFPVARRGVGYDSDGGLYNT